MVDLRVSARTGTALAGLFGVAIAGTALSIPAFAVEAPVPDISGIYWARVYNPKLQIVGGGGLPLTPEGRATYEKNAKGLNDGSIADNARKLCVPDGLPRVLATPYPFEIVQAPPGQVTMIYELNHQVRMIALDKPLPSKDDLEIFPFYNGHSVGKYEGDTLVVTSAGFKDNPITFLDATGAPHTDEMTTTERIRKISPTQLEDVITIHDPKYYTRDFQVRFVYTQRNDIRLEDYVCGEPHRDIYSIPGVRKP